MRRPVVVTTVVHRVAVLRCFPTSALTCLTGSFNEWQINLYLRLSSNCHSRPTVAVDSHLKGKVVEFEFESKCQVGGSGCRNHYAALWGLPLHSCLCVSVCVCVCPSPNITALVQKRAGDCQCVLIITRDKVIIKAELAASACSDIVLKHQLQRDTHLSIRSAPCVNRDTRSYKASNWLSVWSDVPVLLCIEVQLMNILSVPPPDFWDWLWRCRDGAESFSSSPPRELIFCFTGISTAKKKRVIWK